MKRIVVAVLAILLLSVLLYAGDDKAVKKEAQKPCQGICAGHDSVKCVLEKGTAACLEKHKNNGCKGHEAGKCSTECLEKCSAECKEKCSAESKEKCSKECLEKCAGHDKPPK